MPVEANLATWNTYQSAWSEMPPARRRQLLDESVAEDCSYTDPSGQAHGRDELLARIEESKRRFPSATFRNDKFLGHHGRAVSHWTMRDGEGTPIFLGTSYARFGDDGRLTEMVGFFESIPRAN